MSDQDSGPIHINCARPLLTRTPDELLGVHRLLATVIRKVKHRATSDEVLYHLEHCEEIDVGAILLLIYCGFTLESLNWLAKADGASDALRTLSRNLTSLWNPHKRKELPRRVGEFLLREVPSQSGVVETLDEWARLLKEETGATEEEADLWQFQISEVVTNSFQHGLNGSSGSEPLLVAGQFRKTEKQVQLAVLDFGVSIPKTILGLPLRRRRADYPDGNGRRNRDGELILHATKKGVTCRSVRENQGAGLPSLVDTVKCNGGHLQILSRNGLMHVDAKRRSRRNLPVLDGGDAYLQGTLTTILLRLGKTRKT